VVSLLKHLDHAFRLQMSMTARGFRIRLWLLPLLSGRSVTHDMDFQLDHGRPIKKQSDEPPVASVLRDSPAGICKEWRLHGRRRAE